MPKYRPFFASLLLGGILLSSIVVEAQDTGRWTAGAPMLSERSEVAVAEVGGNVFVVGGIHDGGIIARVVRAFFGGQREIEIYDPALDRWSRGAAIPRQLHHAAVVGLNGKLYVVGGYSDGSTPVDSLYEYDPAGDRWRTLAPMPTARGALAAAVIDGKIHTVSGSGTGRRNTPAHEVYDPISNTWSARAPIPTPRDHLAAAEVSA